MTAAADPATHDAPLEGAGRGRVLVVDDDRLVLATLVHGLAQAGFAVIDADNGDDAILLARQERPDLALLDIRMDGMSGFDVASYLRDHLQIPFMFLSAFSDEATVARIRALGALAYLVKPLDVTQIVPAVNAAFAQVRAARDGGTAGEAAAVPDRQAQPVATAGWPTVVAIAVGIVMHRWSLTRDAAYQRLQRIAHQENGSLEAVCAGMVAAVEQLAAAGDD